MEKYIYFNDGKLACSVCGDFETIHGDDGFKRFKLHPIFNKNIVNPSSVNSDLLFWTECPTCRKSTAQHVGPYLYY